MNWGSWSAFWHMGGYAFYVWGSYAVTLLCVVGECLLLAHRRRTLLKTLNQMHRLGNQDGNETPT
ncbi:heme exporter protein CcmD [Thiobacter aerophilum]|uniref:Heme exporter protein D n=1 Tax=Thiobacter aerophilum TaxID=3121275 RepID=A0ABV0EF26_9BURK